MARDPDPDAGVPEGPCKRLSGLGVDHARGRLPAEPAREVDAHLAACPACFRACAEQPELVGRLRAAASGDVPTRATPSPCAARAGNQRRFRE